MPKIKYFPIDRITYCKQATNEEKPMFSILIATWNNLDYLKLCVASILKNSTYKHQILIHVNDGSDGTLEWVKSEGYSYTHSAKNIGICFAFNAISSFIKADYVLLIDDDNYVAPLWDKYLVDEIRKVGHKYFSISSTRLEPYPENDNTSITLEDFGKTASEFREGEFLQKYASYELDDWYGSSWYPLVVHRDLWFTIGGLSPEFSPGMGSDPDFMMKLWQIGVRYFKGVSASRAYHFRSKTTGKVVKNDGRKDFVNKWKMRNSTFLKYFLKMGQKFNGALDEKQVLKEADSKIASDRLRLFFLRK